MLHRFNRHLFKLCAIALGFLMLVQAADWAQAQVPQPQTPQPTQPQVVMLGGKPVFEVKTGLQSFSAEQRATDISQRLTEVANNYQLPVDSIRTEMIKDVPLIVAGQNPAIPIATIDAADAAIANQTEAALAQSWTRSMKTAVTNYRQERSIENILRGIGYTILATLGFFLAVNLLNWLFSMTLDRLKIWLNRVGERLRNSGRQRFTVTPFISLAIRFAELARNLLYLLLLCVYIFLILGFFPWTQGLSLNFWSILGSTIASIEQGIVSYLPELITLIFIIFITREILAFTRLFFREVELGNIAAPWFYPDWAKPTFDLTRFFIIALAVAIGLPFLPGFKSPAFQGVSLVLSALFTLGAASAFSNIVGGIISVYTRGFQIGDMVQVGEQIGIINEKNLLVTRIRTPKNVVITVPNSALIGNNVINYSALSRDTDDQMGLILHTTITLGYDIPWQKVHEALIRAAKATPDVLTTPPPFVLQTALNDYNVSYELNAYTDHPERMPAIYSDLHQNIQDYCNQGGIEILSPGYLAMRDGNHSTIPASYLPNTYKAPGFTINGLDSK